MRRTEEVSLILRSTELPSAGERVAGRVWVEASDAHVTRELNIHNKALRQPMQNVKADIGRRRDVAPGISTSSQAEQDATPPKLGAPLVANLGAAGADARLRNPAILHGRESALHRATVGDCDLTKLGRDRAA